jgi:hypothetical protein
MGVERRWGRYGHIRSGSTPKGLDTDAFAYKEYSDGFEAS